MVYSAVRERPQAQEAAPGRAEVSTRAVVSLDDRRYVLEGPRATIGRSKDADCVLRDPNVSRRHAELRRSPAGDWTIVDLGSTNGVKVNGRRIGSARLTPGDSVTLGDDHLPVRHRAVGRPRPGSDRGLRPYFRRTQVRLPVRPLPLPALDRSLGAQGPAPHRGPGARRDRLPPGACLRRAGAGRGRTLG